MEVRVDTIERADWIARCVAHRSDPQPSGAVAPPVVEPVVWKSWLGISETRPDSGRRIELEYSALHRGEHSAVLSKCYAPDFFRDRDAVGGARIPLEPVER